MKKRLNIGFLVDDLNNYFTNQACIGAEMAAKVLDANLFIYPGHYLGTPDGRYESTEFEYQYNTLFTLPTEHYLDIIYVLLGTIGSRAAFEEQKRFIESLPDVPVVTLFAELDGYPSVTFDNRSGIERITGHLIEKHGVRRIGYVSGPDTNKDSRERLQAFLDTAASKDVEITESQIVYGDFTENSADIVERLLDDNPDLQAVIFANDSMAVGGYKVFARRGLVVGKDILVAGFDDDIFASSMTPPLTTVEASSADLTYQAVLAAEEFLSDNAPDSIAVETYLVQRNSCGCDNADQADMRTRLKTFCLTGDIGKCTDSIKRYLFGVYVGDEETSASEAVIEDFCGTFGKYLAASSSEADVDRSFEKIVDSDILRHVGVERLFNVLQALRSEGDAVLPDSAMKLNDMFSEYYMSLSLKGLSMMGGYVSRRDKISRLVNKQTGDIFIMSNEGDVPYGHLIDGLDEVGLDRTYLYMFQGNSRNTAGETWRCPKSVLLKAYADGSGVHTPRDQQQLLRTEQIFTNEFITGDKRRTMTVLPLFVGEELYGFVVNDVDSSDLSSTSMVAYQLSVSLKSLLMIEEQNKVKKELQNSLEKFMRDNSLLTREAKQDELTGIYNRRGFLEASKEAIEDRFNHGKRAIICYADMDNLKMINDKFGHDDGDFALRETAMILQEAFRNTDIIGRIGGDEFVAFALVGDLEDHEQKIRERVVEVMRKHNEAAGKPYPIEMSLGICDFECSESVDIYALLDQADEKLYIEKSEKKRKNGSYR